MQAEKDTRGPKIYILRLIFQRLCDDYQCLILVFSSGAPEHCPFMPSSLYATASSVPKIAAVQHV